MVGGDILQMFPHLKVFQLLRNWNYIVSLLDQMDSMHVKSQIGVSDRIQWFKAVEATLAVMLMWQGKQ